MYIYVKQDEPRQTTAEPKAGIKRGSQNIPTSVSPVQSTLHDRGVSMQFDLDAQDDAALGPGLCYTATATPPYMA